MGLLALEVNLNLHKQGYFNNIANTRKELNSYTV